MELIDRPEMVEETFQKWEENWLYLLQMEWMCCCQEETSVNIVMHVLV